jgi:hypothetical protein
LKPRKYQGADGQIREQSQILIFDTCRELILELETNRYPMLKPGQSETQDTTGRPSPVRKCMTDLLRYLEMEDLDWIDPTREISLTSLRLTPKSQASAYSALLPNPGAAV